MYKKFGGKYQVNLQSAEDRRDEELFRANISREAVAAQNAGPYQLYTLKTDQHI